LDHYCVARAITTLKPSSVKLAEFSDMVALFRMFLTFLLSVATARAGTLPNRNERQRAPAHLSKRTPADHPQKPGGDDARDFHRNPADRLWKDEDPPEEEPRVWRIPTVVVVAPTPPSRFERIGGAVIATLSTLGVLWYLFGGRKKKTKGGPKSTKEPLLSAVKYRT
jgi:hypothetical protein